MKKQWTACTSEGTQVEERHLGMQDTEKEWFLLENIHFPAITSAQNHTKQTENAIGTVKLPVPKMTVSAGSGDCERAALAQKGGGGRMKPGTISTSRPLPCSLLLVAGKYKW